jgi:hypothetical protein
VLDCACSALEPKENRMNDDRKGTKRDFSPYDLNAVAKVTQAIRDSSQKPVRPGEPYNVGSTPRPLSLSGRTKNR